MILPRRIYPHVKRYIVNKKHLKNVGPIRHCKPPHAACFTLPFTRCRYCRTPPLSHAACASMSTTTSTTTTTTTTRDRGDRYGPMEWAQLGEIWGAYWPDLNEICLITCTDYLQYQPCFSNAGLQTEAARCNQTLSNKLQFLKTYNSSYGRARLCQYVRCLLT